MRGVHGGKAQARQRALSPTPINITIAYSGPRHPVVHGGPPPRGGGRGGRSANAAAAALRLGAARCTRATNLKRAAWWVRARRDALEQLLKDTWLLPA